MLKQSFFGIMLALLLICMLTLTYNIQPVRAQPSVIVVPDNYSTIQEAINHAVDGDLIFVRNGAYHENVVITKAVSVIGESSAQHPVIIGDQTVAVVKIVANNVTIAGFDVTNGGYGDYYGDGLLGGGIELFGVSNCIVANNNAYDNKACGISLVNANSNNVANNTCLRNWIGIRLWSWSPQTTSYNIIHNNTCSEHFRDGIGLWSYVAGTTSTSNNYFTNNVCYLNGLGASYSGISLGKSNGNTLSENIIFDNPYGIGMEVSAADNLIFHNDLINNGRNAGGLWGGWVQPNTWDNGYPSGGNYWSDYGGSDIYSGPLQNLVGSDGIGDAPYFIDANIDHYPLMHNYNPFNYVRLVITINGDGTTNPLPGTHYYTKDSTVQVTARPSENRAFDHWELDGVNVGSANPYEVIMGSAHSLKAIFKLFVSISPLSASIYPTQSLTFVSTLSGGTPPFSYQWYLNSNPIAGATSANWIFGPQPIGNYRVYLSVADSLGNTAKSSEASVIVNPIPNATTIEVFPNSVVINSGQIATYTVNVSRLVYYSANLTIHGLPVGALATFNPEMGLTPFTSILSISTMESTPTGNYTLTIIATSINGTSFSKNVTLSTHAIFNHPPVITELSAPLAPVKLGSEILVNASFTDAETLDTHFGNWDWGDGSASAGTLVESTGSGNIIGSHNYSTPGIYTLNLTLSDNHGASDSKVFQYVVVYDPTGGFVTGGGWIISPTGAYGIDPTLSGKAIFGFVSKYQKGATVLTGDTEFQFHAGNMNFKSTSYEWLVVTGGTSPRAQYKGSGTINGAGNYTFMLTAIDAGEGKTDMFRIKIWDQASGIVVYDNQLGASETADPTTAIAGGSIIIHTQ